MNPRRVSPDLVQQRLATIRDLLADLETVGAVDETALTADRLLRHAVERVLTQLVELAGSINGHVLAAHAGQAPSTYRSSFIEMGRRSIISPDLAGRLGRAAGMRNLLVHEYGEIDLRLVAAALAPARLDFEEYSRSIAGWLMGQQSEPPTP